MKLEKVTILGAGTMGRGIAQWFAQQRVNVELWDLNPKMLADATSSVTKSWEKLQAKGKFKAEEVQQFQSSWNTVIAQDKLSQDSQLVIEAIIEDIDAKANLFQFCEKHFSKQTILASNTSSISISEMANKLSPENKARFLGLHFFNPVPIMKLVEIIAGADTLKSLSDDLSTWFEQKGKMPARCKDTPGFIVNRVARNFYGEAFRIVGNNDLDKIKDVDKAIEECGQFRMGPFKLMDLIGIDVNYDVTCSVWKDFFREPRFEPHALQKEMVQSGKIGRKVGKGFYDYE